MRFDLPLPPTANNAYPTSWKTHRRYPSRRVKNWKEEAGWIIKQARPGKIDGPYTFTILIPEKARGDADGYIKLPQDLLAHLGLTPNDRKAKRSLSERDPGVKPGCCVVIVEAV